MCIHIYIYIYIYIYIHTYMHITVIIIASYCYSGGPAGAPRLGPARRQGLAGEGGEGGPEVHRWAPEL